MTIAIDGRNGQHLANGHVVMCACKTYAHTGDGGVLQELSRIANDARDYCLDAPDMLPTGGMTESDQGPHGWFQRLTHRDSGLYPASSKAGL